MYFYRDIIHFLNEKVSKIYWICLPKIDTFSSWKSGEIDEVWIIVLVGKNRQIFLKFRKIITEYLFVTIVYK